MPATDRSRSASMTRHMAVQRHLARPSIEIRGELRAKERRWLEPSGAALDLPVPGSPMLVLVHRKVSEEASGRSAECGGSERREAAKQGPTCKFNDLPRDAGCAWPQRSTTEHDRPPQDSRRNWDGSVLAAQCDVRYVSRSTLESTAVKTIKMTIDERLLKVVDKMTRAYTRKPVAPGEFDIWLSEQDLGTS